QQTEKSTHSQQPLYKAGTNHSRGNETSVAGRAGRLAARSGQSNRLLDSGSQFASASEPDQTSSRSRRSVTLSRSWNKLQVF
uniref:Uncharacterized protein n=1 Tax=Anopheles epiroticus TaxID=199890 RepID=A0A182PMA5_9DIPT